MTGKIKWGDTVLETAKRELYEETKLKGEPVVIHLYHYRVFQKDTDELLEDKFLFLCLVENPTGTLRPNNEGKFEWMTVKEFEKVENHFISLEDLQSHIVRIKNFKGQMTFTESEYFTDKF
jgi:8-oxo-dGTP pyrophosphatase MutT (NUDIX family)